MTKSSGDIWFREPPVLGRCTTDPSVGSPERTASGWRRRRNGGSHIDRLRNGVVAAPISPAPVDDPRRQLLPWRRARTKAAGSRKHALTWAEGVGFEPTGLLTQSFSRASQSAALPPLPGGSAYRPAQASSGSSDVEWGRRQRGGSALDRRARLWVPQANRPFSWVVGPSSA